MTACTSCADAARQLSHAFTSGCPGCAARAVSRGPHYRRVQQAGVLDRQYRSELEQLGVGHDAVKAAAAADWMAKESTCR